MTVYEIPLSPQPQKLTISLAGVQYNLTVKYNSALSGLVKDPCWVLDIADINDVPIVRGIPIVTGADLLEQYGYLNLGGQLVAQTDHSVDAVPTYTNLGLQGHLFFLIDP